MLTRRLASLVFVAIAVFLVIYTWLPARDGLRYEEAQVSNIIPRSNTWYEVELTTSTGTRLSCRTRHGWPLLGPSRCPLERFEQLQGQRVTVLHDGQHTYEVKSANELVVDYAAHRRAQIIAIVIAVLMLAMAFADWRGNASSSSQA
ncbi:MAG: hypothetical protein Q8S26_02215 [Azonexus sp.]|nr:hypothetical protein [Azonexus sp.]